MNAPANILTGPKPVTDLERGYRASISIHYPNLDPFTMSTRVKLMAWRDRLSAALRVCSDDSYRTLTEALRLASNYALSASDVRTLMRIDAAIFAMFEAAKMIERASRGRSQ